VNRPPLYVRRPFLAGLLRQLPLTFDHWRQGLAVIGLALLGGAVLRLLLPVRRVGFLAVRSRPTDVVLLAGAGLALTVAALTIPAG
jgi:hypothetical protein